MTSMTTATNETTFLDNGTEQLLDWPEEEGEPLPRQFGDNVQEPIRYRFVLNMCRNFVVALFCVIIACAFVFYFSFSNQLGPCKVMIEETHNLYGSKTLAQLKPLVLAANVTSITIKQLVRRLFDRDMDCLIALESTQKGKDVFMAGEISGEDLPRPEPNIITYYQDRLRNCKTLEACDNDAIEHLAQQLDIQLKTHPLSPENFEGIPITDIFCGQKKNEINGILKRIGLLKPAQCTVNQVHEWEKLTYALLATRERIAYFIGLANVAEASSGKPFRRRISISTNPYEKPRFQLN